MCKVYRTFCKVMLTFVALTTIVVRPASAQITPADSAALLLGAAEDFDLRGQDDIARALYRHIARSYPGTPAAQAALERLGEVGAGAAGIGSTRPEPPGDTELKVFATLYGLWLGIIVPDALDLRGDAPNGAGLLVGGPVGYFAGRAFAQSRPVSLGQARAIIWGGTWGTWQGLALAAARNEYPSDRAVAASMIVGGTLGVLGGAVASGHEISSGTAMSAALGTVWGAWFGAASSVLFDLGDRPTLATMVVAGNAGLAAGAVAGNRWSISSRRARLVTLSGMIGGFAGAGWALITLPESDRYLIAAPLAGSILGLAFGAATIKDDRADPPVPANGPAAALSPTGALLSRTGGSWSLSAPAPSPFWVPPPRDGGRRALAWKVPLLEIRF